jgi:hypothetical protein
MLEHDWVDFGQQERLTVRLKELIRNYPRGIGIIKEFIQNADDAGTRSLSVLLDLRVHPANHVPDPRMKALMGPALLIVGCADVDGRPLVFLDVYEDGQLFWIVREYYWDSMVEMRQKTDAEYADDLMKFIGPNNDAKVIIDPEPALTIAS